MGDKAGRPCKDLRGKKVDLTSWVQVKQVFVRRGYRKMGYAKEMFNRMLSEVAEEHRRSIRLFVLDLNYGAKAWYRRLGFYVAGISQEELGRKEDLHLVVYEEMHRCEGGCTVCESSG